LRSFSIEPHITLPVVKGCATLPRQGEIAKPDRSED
jgi:hypothetical protein